MDDEISVLGGAFSRWRNWLQLQLQLHLHYMNDLFMYFDYVGCLSFWWKHEEFTHGYIYMIKTNPRIKSRPTSSINKVDKSTVYWSVIRSKEMFV